jgi:hypothetical protein
VGSGALLASRPSLITRHTHKAVLDLQEQRRTPEPMSSCLPTSSTD